MKAEKKQTKKFKVYMFNGTSWKLLGKMSDAQAGATYFTSAKIVDGGFAYGGEEYATFYV